MSLVTNTLCTTLKAKSQCLTTSEFNFPQIHDIETQSLDTLIGINP
jgi:hypothetical protein